MSLNPIKVVLADDHAMVRESLARVLESSGAVSVIGQARDGLELLGVMEAEVPDCVVLDYSMPKLDAPHTIERLTGKYQKLKILVLTVHENVHYAVRALEAGAHGYMIKSAAVEELVDAIGTVYRGGTYLSPRVSEDVWAQLRRPKRQRIGVESLSQREFDVLRILGTGISLQECAEQMNVSTSSISTYRSRILEKLNLTSTPDLIRFAIENKVVG